MHFNRSSSGFALDFFFWMDLKKKIIGMLTSAATELEHPFSFNSPYADDNYVISHRQIKEYLPIIGLNRVWNIWKKYKAIDLLIGAIKPRLLNINLSFLFFGLEWQKITIYMSIIRDICLMLWSKMASNIISKWPVNLQNLIHCWVCAE